MKKTKSGFYLVENLFTKEQRKELINGSQPLLENLTNHPAEQSLAMQVGKGAYPQFKWAFDRFIDEAEKATGDLLEWDSAGCWFARTNGKAKHVSWHRHPTEWVGVYYLKTFPMFSNGTLFEHGIEKAPQNSLLIFNGGLLHTPPRSPFSFDRYVMSMNWNLKPKP